jgi:hypothetical protein
LRRRCVRSFSHLKALRIMLVLNIYHYTLKPTLLPLSANCGSLRQSLELCIFRARPCERLKDSPAGSSGNRMRVTTAILALSLELFMRSRECRKSKQLFSSYSRRGYSGSRSFFRWESNLQRLKALLNMHEEHLCLWTTTKEF